jgi:hypothetical protein
MDRLAIETIARVTNDQYALRITGTSCEDSQCFSNISKCRRMGRLRIVTLRHTLGRADRLEQD